MAEYLSGNHPTKRKEVIKSSHNPLKSSHNPLKSSHNPLKSSHNPKLSRGRGVM
jgi:hypothetical protein